jgi:YhcH/YjgK/YiaL family protein
MVVDRIQNAHLYRGLGAGIEQALALIGREDFRAAKVGKHEVKGASLSYLVQSFVTKAAAQAAWESHRRYLDVQYIVEATERMGWAPVSSLTVTRRWDAGTDAAFHTGQGTFFTAGPGTFFLFWPGDAHMPGVAEDAPSPVLKFVVKVLLEEAAS